MKLSEEILADIAKRAVEEHGYFSCSRNVVYALQKYFDFISDDILRASVMLSGGGNKATVGSCGAFSGGLMVLSAKCAPKAEDATPKAIEAYHLQGYKFQEFRDWFIETFGTVTCKDVQCHQLGRSFNFMNPKEIGEFIAFPGVDEKCGQVYSQAARKVAEILAREDAAL